MGNMSKLTWEWSELGNGDRIIIRKPKGKLTVDEIVAFLNEREQIYAFGEGALCVIAWRNSSDSYSGWDLSGEQKGDDAEVFVLQDDSQCFCGKVLHLQYCPKCGEPLWDK